MKKTLALLAVLMLSVTVFAGPIVGLSFVPVSGNTASVYFGWQSENEWAATVSISKLNTWKQDWTIGALWTPALWGGAVNLRAGGNITINWANTIRYKDLGLFLGAEKWVTPMVGFYGQLNLNSALQLSPMLGVEINFWSPPANTHVEYE